MIAAGRELRPRRVRSVLVLVAGLLMVCAVGQVYAPARAGVFLWDDHVLVERDAGYRHTPVMQLFTEGAWLESPLADARAAYYRPVTLLSFRLDARFDDSAKQYHATNIWLHGVAAGLLAVVAWRLGASGAVAVI
ncbi:MAG: hypothetical protein KF764_18440, partial [Labilithrix sp.]|nr:hypothetical protein [Labilithrix sp.]